MLNRGATMIFSQFPIALSPARAISRAAIACIAALGAAGVALAAPAVQQVSGSMDHNGTITISGSGFGAKASAAPVVWDNATASSLSSVWTGAWPDKLPGYNTGYYAPMRNIDLPHSHDTRYIAGAHAANTGADSGYAVMVFKAIQAPALPYFIYASWYQRADDQWHFGGDNNFKTFDYSTGTEPYAQQSWYTAYGPPHPSSPTDAAQQWTYETGTPLQLPDQNGHNAWWGNAVNPMGGAWSKVEISIRVSNGQDGYVKVLENGRSVVSYSGVTDNWAGSQRTISVGGYARMQGYASNWRYFDDIYVDTTLQRVVIADKPVLSQARIIETQIPSAWSDGSITATVNLGKFTQGQTAYLFVVDATGTPSAKGQAVTAGGNAFMPNAPSSVAVH
jgi:hypothetical protein